MLSDDILEKIIYSIKSINLNLSTIQEIKNKIKKENNSIENKDGFNILVVWLKDEIEKIREIHYQINLKKDEKAMYLAIIINKLSIFVNNFSINDPNFDKKIEDLQNSNKQLLNKLSPDIYNNYFDNLNKIEKSFEKLLHNGFLSERIDYNKIFNYNEILKQYSDLLKQYNNVENDLNNSDRVDLKNLLISNYNNIEELYKRILLNILDNDSVFFIDINLFNKIKSLINDGNYDYLLSKNLLSFEITNKNIRVDLDNELKILIDDMSFIINTYRSRKMDKNNLVIDHSIDNDKKNKNNNNNLNDIDLPAFVNEVYDRKRKEGLKKYQLDADKLEHKLTSDGNLTVGKLKTLKKIRNMIKKVGAGRKKAVSKFKINKLPLNFKLQKDFSYKNIQKGKIPNKK